MAVNLSPVGGVAAQFFDNSGNPLTGGKLYTYLAGTTTPATTYTTAAGSVAQPNPIILDAAGRVPGSGEIWLTDGINYKFVLTTSTDVLIATYDGISGINSNFVAFTNQQEIQTATAGQTVFDLTTMSYQPGTNSLTVFVDGVNQYGPGAQYAYVETDSDTVTFVNGLHVGAEVKFTTSQLNSSVSQANAFQVSYTPPFTGSAPTNVGNKLAQTVSVKDFGAVGDGVADDTAAIQAAIDAYDVIYFPAGSYRVNSTISDTADRSLKLFGDGYASQIITADVADPAFDLPPGYGTGTDAMFWFNVRDLLVEGLRFTSQAPVTYIETSGPGVFFRTDTDTTAYPQKITFRNCYSEQAGSDFLESGIFAGTGNDVIVEITGNYFYYSGRYDVTVQNCLQLNAINNVSVDSGAFFDVEPNGASDVARLVNISNNNIKNAQYNCIQVSVSISGNRGACVISSNVMEMSETFTPSVAIQSPINVRMLKATVSDNVLLKGKCGLLALFDECQSVTFTGNMLNATVQNPFPNTGKLILESNNVNVYAANNYLELPNVGTYAATFTGALGATQKVFSIDPAAQTLKVGGLFENRFQILGASQSLDARAFIDMGDLTIDSQGTVGIERTQFTARKSAKVGIELKANGSLKTPNLPTSASGLSTGDLWVDTGAGNVIKIIP